MNALKVFFVALVVLALVLLSAAQDPQEIPTLGVSIDNVESGEGQYKCYYVNVDSLLSHLKDTDHFTVSVTPSSGDADLFVDTNRCDPQCTTCWKAESPNGDMISIQKSDPRWPTSPARFYITVLAKTRTVFSLNTWATGTHIQVKNGLPQSATSFRRQFTYFEYDLDDSSNFTISVTPVSGDPDIFASVQYSEPNSTFNSWESKDWGLDVIDIRTNHPDYRAPAKYYVSVYAYTDTFFTLAITKNQDYALLSEGIPLGGDLQRHEYKFFKFYLSRDIDGKAFFTVNPISSRGDPDMYINYEVADPKPTRGHAQYSSRGSGSDTISIPARKGYYYIGIYAFSETKFQLLATTEMKNVILYDGVTNTAVVEKDKWRFFKYYHGDTDSGVTVTISSIGASQVDAYESRIGTFTDPNKYDHKLPKSGHNSLFVRASPVEVGTYYFGVLGLSEGLNNFTITAATNQSHTILRDGQVSFWNFVPRGYYRFFIFDDNDLSQDVTITVNPWRGEVDLYASTVNRFPTRANHSWSSATWKQDTIVIPAFDPELNARSRVYIGVHATIDSFFSITVFLANTSIEIQDGSPASGAVTQSKFRYYKFYNFNAGSATINLQLTSGGDADLYASYSNQHPNQYDNDYKATRFGADVIDIPYLRAGWIYIGVYGASGDTVTYLLTIRVNFNFLTVNMGSLLSYTPRHNTTKFQSYVWQDCDYLIPSVTLISGRTNMYVSTNATATPGPNNTMWQSTTWPGNVLLIKKDDPKFKHGIWAIGVEAAYGSDYFIGLTCVRSTGGFSYGDILSEGVPRLTMAATDAPTLFRFRIPYNWQDPEVKEDYTVYIRMISGSTNVYIDQDWRVIPNPRNYTFSSHGSNDRLMQLSKTQLKQGYVYIAVSAEFRPATLEISAGKASVPKHLIQDQPQLERTFVGGKSYFRMLNARFRNEIHVYTESCNNAPAPTIYGDFNKRHPDSTNFTYKSEKVSDSFQYLRAEIEGGDHQNTPTLFYLGTENPSTAPEEAVYSVFATHRIDSRPHVTGKSIIGGEKNGKVLIRFSKAEAPIYFNQNDLVYHVFATKVNVENNRPEPINMDTPCGIRLNGVPRGIASEYSPLDGRFEFILDLDPKDVYRINVLVSDGFGLSASYDAVWLVNGQIYRSWPGWFIFHASIGFILLLISFMIFLTYFVLGCVINLVRGKRGLQIIPNVDFWKDLPFLVFDGIMLILTCCRRPETYNEFRDEPSVNVSGFGATTPTSTSETEEKPKPETTASSASGYGSI